MGKKDDFRPEQRKVRQRKPVLNSKHKEPFTEMTFNSRRYIEYMFQFMLKKRSLRHNDFFKKKIFSIVLEGKKSKTKVTMFKVWEFSLYFQDEC